MKRKAYKEESSHEAHPVRNFLYLLYTFLNAAAFVGLFYGETVGLRAVSLPSLALLVLALFVGVIDAMKKRKR